MKFSRIAFIFVVLTNLVFAASYKLDQAHSSVGFKIKHLMISNVKGSFAFFDGSIEYDKKAKKLVAVNGEVEAESIDTGIEKRDNHLRSADFFDVEKFEFIRFKSTKIEGDNLFGEFTIRGVTKNVKFEIEDLAGAIDPQGKHRIGFTIEGEINRKDYGLNWNKVLETGGIVVGDTVKIEVEIEAIEK